MAPTVYIVLIATLCYVTRQETLVRGIWLVSVFYFPIRVLYNVALGRFLLLNWISIVGQTILGISASYLAYVHLILPKTPLLPSAESVRDQLWIIIALFFYATFNNIRTSNAASIRRKNRYIESQFKELRQKYGSLVDGQFSERYMEAVAYAILVYETFNRPHLARVIERAVFPWGSHTLGPMQVYTTTWLSDFDSVAVGTERLREAFAKTNDELIGKHPVRYQVIRMALAKYNRDEKYISELFEVLHVLWAQVATEYRPDIETMYT
jgi:HD-GYP domain-containing protein (c-di-GMP phosphodiesterase class II)